MLRTWEAKEDRDAAGKTFGRPFLPFVVAFTVPVVLFQTHDASKRV